MTYPPNIMKKSDKVEAQVTDGITRSPSFATHDVYLGDFSNGTHKKVKKAIMAAAKTMEGRIDYYFPAASNPKANAVLKAQSNLASSQCLEFLDSFSLLYLEIEGGGMSPKDTWVCCLAYAKQVFDVVKTVRAVNNRPSVGSYIWASF